MKKNIFLLVFFVLNGIAFSQNPGTVTVSANLPNPVCRNSPVTLTANPVNTGNNLQFLWVIGEDTTDSGPTFVTSEISVYVELLMISVYLFDGYT